MATTYTTGDFVVDRPKAGRGLLRRWLDAYIEARQQEANRRILRHLQNLDHTSLRTYGFSDAQIDRIYNQRILP